MRQEITERREYWHLLWLIFDWITLVTILQWNSYWNLLTGSGCNFTHTYREPHFECGEGDRIDILNGDQWWQHNEQSAIENNIAKTLSTLHNGSKSWDLSIRSNRLRIQETDFVQQDDMETLTVVQRVKEFPPNTASETESQLTLNLIQFNLAHTIISYL